MTNLELFQKFKKVYDKIAENTDAIRKVISDRLNSDERRSKKDQSFWEENQDGLTASFDRWFVKITFTKDGKEYGLVWAPLTVLGISLAIFPQDNLGMNSVFTKEERLRIFSDILEECTELGDIAIDFDVYQLLFESNKRLGNGDYRELCAVKNLSVNGLAKHVLGVLENFEKGAGKDIPLPRTSHSTDEFISEIERMDAVMESVKKFSLIPEEHRKFVLENMEKVLDGLFEKHIS